MKKWITLIGYGLVTFINALGPGVFSNNLQTYARYYTVSTYTISNVYYIALLIQIFLFFPAIKMIQWRFDYAMYSAAYFACCSYWLLYVSNHNYALAVAFVFLNSLGELLILPTIFYYAQRWFKYQERAIVIGFGFYINLLGYASGALIASLYVADYVQNVQNQFLFLSIVSSIIFPITVLTIPNKPKITIQKSQIITQKHLKMLWKNKFLAYNLVCASAILGVIWSFQIIIFQLDDYFTSIQIGAFMGVWVLTGCIFGFLASILIHLLYIKTGQFKFYDWASKILFTIYMIGLLVLGITLEFQNDSFFLVISLMALVGIGSIGLIGLTFFSMLQTLHPLPSLLQGTILVVGASIYSFASQGINFLDPYVNIYFSLLATLLLPWIYFCFSYQTNFKRYKCYLNQKQAKYQLIKLQQESSKQQ